MFAIIRSTFLMRSQGNSKEIRVVVMLPNNTLLVEYTISPSQPTIFLSILRWIIFYQPVLSPLSVRCLHGRPQGDICPHGIWPDFFGCIFFKL